MWFDEMNFKYLVSFLNFRYQPSERVSVTVEPAEPIIVNFTLKQDLLDDQGNQDVDFPRMLPLFNQYPALYKLIVSYDDSN